MLHEAKYGQLAGNDPVKALQRDSSFVDERNGIDESAVGRMYETQLMQLEHLIAVQRCCHNRSKQVSFRFKRLIITVSFNKCTGMHLFVYIRVMFLLASLFWSHALCLPKHKNFGTKQRMQSNYSLPSVQVFRHW